jgi:hypothetical protein
MGPPVAPLDKFELDIKPIVLQNKPSQDGSFQRFLERLT